MYSEIISSAHNPAVKHLKKLLTSGKYRRQQGLAVAEGVHLLSSYLQTDQLPRQIVHSEAALHNQEIVELLDSLKPQGVSSIALKDSLFESLASVHASVGLLMVFEPNELTIHQRLSGKSLLLEDIQDPGNLGTILRTAAASGVDKVYLTSESASPWSPKSLRAGMGAQFGLKIYEKANLVSLATGAATPVLATDLAGSKSVFDADLRKDIAWVFGSEGQGVSRQLLDACSDRVRIPQVGTSIESLNVSAAVAVCLYEQFRQRRTD